MSTRRLCSEDVLYLQRTLLLRDGPLEVDGIFGEKTESALKSFQRRHGIADTGVACSRTRDMLEQQARAFHLLCQADLADAAVALGVPRSVIYTVMSVETAGLGFLLDGQPRILFERHIMYRRLLCAGLDANACAARNPDIVNVRPGGYLGGTAEYERLAQAIAMSRTAALESCSWGLFQVMGFHWHLLGHANVQRFVEAMQESERRQLDAFATFIQCNPALHRALQTRNWANFAEGYNGPNYRANAYDARLKNAYAHFDTLISPRA
jgi:hypothetical protein